ncbi:hypothetical protein LAC81_28920 [Ensifer adhaerens]|uniref:hypothetical protein n=1 Tax=Ensifer adhaerens TaxID=106592 RepID=UPI001CBD26AF|nr:hypothetical protein [Ensifer adhaerens]MBZ7924763.1 hypothetical protein [Ensifer adhaerens]UAX96014.1 hypothetical protein LAC78_34910 [Ensifer adhaerens]UAY04645.1 hypothetical protein LAC80_25400 [Ensifer adhaerens]UAY10076.1 hypothetical protein LAC81_28920 [Ensifer adhaerens]
MHDLLQHSPVSSANDHVPNLRFGPDDKLVYRGVEYGYVASNTAGHVLRRKDGSNILEPFSHKLLAAMLADVQDPLVVYPGAYKEGAAPRGAKGTDLLSSLRPHQQKAVIKKDRWCRRWLQLEYQETNVTRSDACMRLHIFRIGEEFKQLLNPTQKRVTYKSKKTAESTPAPSTLRRWLRDFEAADYDPIVFVDKYLTARPSPLDPEVQQMMAAFARMYASDAKPKMNELYDQFVAATLDENKRRAAKHMPPLDLPCLRTFQNRINDLPRAFIDLGRLGEAAAAKKYAIVLEGIDPIRPFERLEQDEWAVDLQTLLTITKIWPTLTAAQKKRLKRVRLWITALIDTATKCFVGLRAHREAPSVKSAIMTLELVTRDKSDIAEKLGCKTPWDMSGTPEVIATDSATWYTSTAFRVVVNDLGSTLFLPPAGAASARGTMERSFRTTGSKALQYFSGQTWGSIAEKGEYPSEKEASVLVDQAAEVITRFFVDVYHNEPHAGLSGETPRNAWIRLSKTHGVLPPPTGHRRRHIFGINRKASITTSGICQNGNWYQSPALQAIRRRNPKVKLLTRVDRWDLGEISAWDGTGWIRVPAVHAELKGMSIWVWAAACERLRLLNREKASVSRETLLKTKQWLQKQGQMARLEAELGTGFITDADFQRFESKISHSIRITEKNDAVPLDDEADWGPSTQFFDLMGMDHTEFEKEPRSPAKNDELERAMLRPEPGELLPLGAVEADEADDHGVNFATNSQFDS